MEDDNIKINSSIPDYVSLSENYYFYRIHHTISPEARKEILKRLLELNHKIHAEEVARGLREKKGKKKKADSTNTNQGGLFGEE